MSQKSNLWLSFCVFILVALMTVYPAFAEIRTFEKEAEEVVSRDQSQEQVEAFALQKAKPLAGSIMLIEPRINSPVQSARLHQQQSLNIKQRC